MAGPLKADQKIVATMNLMAGQISFKERSFRSSRYRASSFAGDNNALEWCSAVTISQRRSRALSAPKQRIRRNFEYRPDNRQLDARRPIPSSEGYRR